MLNDDVIKNYTYNQKQLKDLFDEINIKEDQDKIYVDLVYSEANFDEKELKKELMKLLKGDHHYQGAKINFINKVKQEIEKHGLLQQPNLLFILVSSGKGGVGKSNVSANLANVLSDHDHRVVLIDADVYGSSLPELFGVEEYPPIKNGILYPIEYHNIDLVSVDFIIRNSNPIMWRGLMLNRVLHNFFELTKYRDNPDIVIIDLPPGTGDMAMDVQQMVPHAKQLVVTTPHPSAAKIAIKAGLMGQRLNHEIIGVIENMSYYNNEGEELDIFGYGGGDQVANVLNVPLLAKLEIALPKDGYLYQKGEGNYQKYEQIMEEILKHHNQEKK
jgi:ATP-binding protein involved in chromosome partitioning